MLQKLRILEATLNDVSKRYHVVATELANLKNKPDNDAKNEATINALTQKLKQSQDDYTKLRQDFDALNEELANKYRQNELLNEENRLLATQNNELSEKNRLAVERAKLIQHWLENIDAGTNEPSP